MGTKKLADNILLIHLPAEPQISKELTGVNETLTDGCDCHVLVDFSRVEIITSSSISNLMILQRLARESGHKLILYNLAIPTRCIFRVVGLEKHFDFAEDKSAALAKLESAD
jgi:anti-anti-sigma regulatory factor